MQLPLTSLIPTVVEFISFWQKSWPNIWWYPDWYLGVPFRYLCGPVVPLVVSFLNRVLPFSILGWYLTLIGGGWIAGAFALLLLIKRLGGGKQARVGAILFLLLPGHILLLVTGSGLHHLGICLLPWLCLVWIAAIKYWRRRDVALTITILVLMFLIDISSLLAALVALGSLAYLFRATRSLEEVLIKMFLVLLAAFALTTIWYTPRFWWVILANPSFGGQPLGRVIPYTVQLLQTFLPVILGIWVVHKRYSFKNKLLQFAVLFSTSFGFLTLIRFLSDTDFWIDWTGYFLELQFGAALLLALAISRYINKRFVILFTILLLTMCDGVLVWNWFIKYSGKIATYKQEIIGLVQNLSSGERVFVSGSPVFWLGSVTGNLLQVRGGKDEVATHPAWAMGSYQIREGESPELLKDWLMAFGVSTVVVSGNGSREYFRDFKHLERFNQFTTLAKVAGNTIYKTEGVIGRIADTQIQRVPKPSSGGDVAISAYAQLLKQPVVVDQNFPSRLHIHIPRPLTGTELVSLAITYDPGWSLVGGSGQIRADSLGNMVILPAENTQDFRLEYKADADWVFGVLFSIVSIALLLNSAKISQILPQKLPTLRVTSDNEEEIY